MGTQVRIQLPAKRLQEFLGVNFALSTPPIQWNSGIEGSAIYWRQTVSIFPLSERIVNNNLQSEEIGTDVMKHKFPPYRGRKKKHKNGKVVRYNHWALTIQYFIWKLDPFWTVVLACLTSFYVWSQGSLTIFRLHQMIYINFGINYIEIDAIDANLSQFSLAKIILMNVRQNYF